MTLFFPDLNVWLALSVEGHPHSSVSWNWRRSLPGNARLIFSRYTQLGLLRLLTNSAVMGDQTLTLRKAWAVYDRWLADPQVEFYPDAANVEDTLRQMTEPFGSRPASKWVGDCWLLSCAHTNQSALVTFDRALQEFARKHGYSSITLA